LLYYFAVRTGSYPNTSPIGKAGNDLLRGDRGRNTLIGGPGTDPLDGGPGRDRLFQDDDNEDDDGLFD